MYELFKIHNFLRYINCDTGAWDRVNQLIDSRQSERGITVPLRKS